MGQSSTLIVLVDAGLFRGLSLTVLGSGVISTVDKPRCAIIGPSLRLHVLADSGPFRGLLLTVLESRSNFHG